MSRRSTRFALALALAVLAAALGAADAVPKQKPAKLPKHRVKIVKIEYRAHNGALRPAWIVLPHWYGRKRNPQIPLEI